MAGLVNEIDVLMVRGGFCEQQITPSQLPSMTAADHLELQVGLHFPSHKTPTSKKSIDGRGRALHASRTAQC